MTEPVAVLGLGVMGGSLARALSALGVEVAAWSPLEEERREARAVGAAGSAPADWRQAVVGAGHVVLAMPLGAVCRAIARMPEATSRRTTISDVAGLKLPVARAVAKAGLAERWVGTHPMAGSEGSGFGWSSPNLYRGATVWVSHLGADSQRLRVVEEMWRAVGARPAMADPGEHDRAMALASHLPQLTANALAATLMDGSLRPEALGPGGRDMTRLAGSGPEMWRNLFDHAPENLPQALRALSVHLNRLAELAERRDGGALAEFMETTRAWRDPA